MQLILNGNKTDDIETLQELSRKITKYTRDQVLSGGILSKLNSKISRIQQKLALERVQNDVSEGVLRIIRALSDNTLDIPKAELDIEAEIQRRMKSNPKSAFFMTEEQQRKQIFIQIRTVLKEKSDKFHLHDPETMILQMQKLAKGELDLNIRCVVQNLISNGQYDEAENICKKFAGHDRQGPMAKSMTGLRKEIRNAKIADMVLKGINMNGTAAEEEAYFDLIERGLKQANIPLGSICLGKNEEGTRTITLADIWSGEKRKTMTR